MAFAYKSDNHMPCYSPVTGYFGKAVNPKTGRRPLVFNISQSFSGIPIHLPCGKCIGCRLERSRQWAVRIEHERKMHQESAFVTLTYAEKHLPENMSLRVRDLQLFMKRLRDKREQSLRFYACGEYGETTRRPHYHVLLLNTCFSDQKFYKQSMCGKYPLYVSAELRSLWPVGDHYIGAVTFESAAYCARYVTKKILGDGAAAHYQGRTPEFCCMSRNPGIGATWVAKYGNEAFRSDSVISNGHEAGVPRYYQNILQKNDPKLYEKNKRKRLRRAARDPDKNNVDRRIVKEVHTHLVMSKYERKEI